MERLFILVFTSLGFGLIFSLSLYFPPLILSLWFSSMRRTAERGLQRGISWLMAAQPGLVFESEAFRLRYAEARALASHSGRGVLLVSNHRSHLDMFLLLARIPGIRVLAKSSLFAVPFVGFFMWTSRQIAVRRRDVAGFVKAMQKIETALKAGDTVHVFPEMTRAGPDQRETGPFSAAPFLTAMRAGAFILPLRIEGTGEVWPKGSYGLRLGGDRAGRVALEPRRLLSPEKIADFESAQALADFCRRRIEDPAEGRVD